MADYKSMSMNDLKARSRELAEREDATRMERKAVNRELAFRDNLELKAKALKGMTQEEIQRVLELSQTVSDAGDVPSEEKVVGLATPTE